MKSASILSVAALCVASIASIASAATCNNSCQEIYTPVCGSDGKTYDNKCTFEYAKCSSNDEKLKIVKESACDAASGSSSSAIDCAKPPMCIAQFDPVCGSDGKTYSNECKLNVAKCEKKELKLVKKGECNGNNASSGNGTLKPGGGDECVTMCMEIWKPVCGSDGKTYGNDCELKNAQCKDTKLTKTKDGSCDGSGSVEIGANPEASECEKPCTKEFKPLCGSDGVTYSNECMLNNAKCKNPDLTKIADGECTNSTNDTAKSTTPAPSTTKSDATSTIAMTTTAMLSISCMLAAVLM